MSTHGIVVSGKPRFLAAARALGHRLTFVAHPDRVDPRCAELADRVVAVDPHSPDLLRHLRELHHADPADYALSLAEDGLRPAGLLNDALGLAGTSAAVAELFGDKALMRRTLAADPGLAVAALAVTGPAQTDAALARCGLPAVVKPAGGTGSDSIAVVHDRDAAVAAVARVLAAGHQVALVEEFLDGPELSVESFSFEGRHTVFACTEKQVDAHHVEIGHTVPAPLAPARQAEVAAAVCRLLDRLGLRDGPAHTEVKLTRRGVRVIESHNRVGGDRITALVALTHGIDLVELTFQWAARAVAPVPAAPAPFRAASIRFLSAGPGTVRTVTPVAAADLVEARLPVPGQRLRPVRRSRDRAGHVIVTAADPDTARARAAELAGRIRIEVAGGTA